MKQLREVLIDVYLDFRNDYLTIEKYAEHNGLAPIDASVLLKLAKDVFDKPHSES